MDLLEQTQQLCRLYNIKPARSKGQNFLIQEDVYDKLIESAELTKDDIVLEVGPGLGFLTAKLAQKVKKVIAVELDDKLTEVLRIGLKTKEIENVEVVNEDILKLEIGNWKFGYANTNFKFQISNFKIVANLPYNITSIFLRKFLSSEIKPKTMVFMLQKEVAERIIAKQGKMNLLAVSIQLYAKPKIIQIVSADNFWPQPKVDSAIIHLTPQPPLLAKEMGSEKEFFRLLKIGFSAKRKMLKNNLAAGYHIGQQETEAKVVKTGFNPKTRAQELSVKDWIKLLEEFKEGVV